jgi:SNF2 family DNA or RNA helicase
MPSIHHLPEVGRSRSDLVAANKVFMVDPWWNPAVEEQAIERVHRIGQKREVEVYRFIVENSIESRMMELH